MYGSELPSDFGKVLYLPCMVRGKERGKSPSANFISTVVDIFAKKELTRIIFSAILHSYFIELGLSEPK